MDTATPERDFLRYRERGDSEALARVFDALAPKLLLVAHHLTRDAAGAEDLVQASFLAALRTARDYDGRRPLLGWMVGILAHRARDERRRARVRAAEPVGAELPARDDPLASSVESETLERITAAVDGLEEPYHEVLVLRLVHGLSPTEIAHALGRAPGTVRRRKLRARLRGGSESAGARRRGALRNRLDRAHGARLRAPRPERGPARPRRLRVAATRGPGRRVAHGERDRAAPVGRRGRRGERERELDRRERGPAPRA
jgi:RNA polymerase sigma-70 factor (ECF subfamily)